jgi:hypothetical protein
MNNQHRFSTVFSYEAKRITISYDYSYFKFIWLVSITTPEMPHLLECINLSQWKTCAHL